MYRLFAIASSFLLLIASSAALTVVDTKSSGFTPIKLDMDMAPPAGVCSRNDRMGPSSRQHRVAYGPDAKQAQHANACCTNYPYCSCPKLETPKLKTHQIRLPAAKQSQSTNSCCVNFPYCSCPKLETSEAKVYQIKLPSAKQASSDSTCSCCPDYPYCSCPKIETPKPRFEVIDVGAASKKSRPKVSAFRGRPKALLARRQ